MTETQRLGPLDLLERAARGVGRVDRDGFRGVTNCSANEIEAMALVLSIMNFPPIVPGTMLSNDELAAFFAENLPEMHGFALMLRQIGEAA